MAQQRPVRVIRTKIDSPESTKSTRMHGYDPKKSDYQLVGARQILQCVGQIKIGSSAQALYQTPNFQRHEKRSGATRVLSSSPTSKSQSSGASRMGSHSVAPHDIQHLEGACNQRSHPPLEATDLSERIPPF